MWDNVAEFFEENEVQTTKLNLDYTYKMAIVKTSIYKGPIYFYVASTPQRELILPNKTKTLGGLTVTKSRQIFTPHHSPFYDQMNAGDVVASINGVGASLAPRAPPHAPPRPPRPR